MFTRIYRLQSKKITCASLARAYCVFGRVPRVHAQYNHRRGIFLCLPCVSICVCESKTTRPRAGDIQSRYNDIYVFFAETLSKREKKIQKRKSHKRPSCVKKSTQPFLLQTTSKVFESRYFCKKIHNLKHPFYDLFVLYQTSNSIVHLINECSSNEN